jgi:hypothetical protein
MNRQKEEEKMSEERLDEGTRAPKVEDTRQARSGSQLGERGAGGPDDLRGGHEAEARPDEPGVPGESAMSAEERNPCRICGGGCDDEQDGCAVERATYEELSGLLGDRSELAPTREERADARRKLEDLIHFCPGLDEMDDLVADEQTLVSRNRDRAEVQRILDRAQSDRDAERAAAVGVNECGECRADLYSCDCESDDDTFDESEDDHAW